ncbi:MAG: hypothetical protein AB8G22_07315 [Saprospiraceae bacterium]
MKWNSDKIVSISAILISLVTLIVFIYQTNIMREQQRLSVLPYLMIANENGQTPNHKLTLRNTGIGPAFIESVVITSKKKKYEMDLPTFLYTHVPEMDSINNLGYSNIFAGQLIPAEQVIPILEFDNSWEDVKKMLVILDELEIEIAIIYKSIYEERWLLSSAKFAPEKL